MVSITIFLPGEIYSANKNHFIKLRKKYDVGNWNGTSWSNPDVLLTTSFRKKALMTGQPHDYDGDILIVSGDLNSPFVRELIKLCENIGGLTEENEMISTLEDFASSNEMGGHYSDLTLERRVSSELEGERLRLESTHMNSHFINKWLALHRNHLTKLYS